MSPCLPDVDHVIIGFTAEKRNKHARVLTVSQAASLKKKWRDSGRLSKQKSLPTLYVF